MMGEFLQLLHAVEKDDINKVKEILESGVNVNAKSRDGFTSLHIAAIMGSENMLDILLEKGADIQSKTEHGFEPLHFAAENGYKNIVKILVEKGAYINAETFKFSLVPLHFATKYGQFNAVEMLLEKGADTNAKTFEGYAPLHLAVESGYTNIVEMLLEKGAYVYERTEGRGFAPLHIAAENGYKNIAAMLLEKGADINAESVSGSAPLHVAAEYGHKNIVKMLIEKGADIHATNSKGYAPLHLVASHEWENVVEMLLEKGADIHAKTLEGYAPLHLAANYGHKNLIQMLLEKGADINAETFEDGSSPLHIAAKYGHKNAVEILLQQGADIHATTHKGYAPLHLAAKYGFKNITEVKFKTEAYFPDIYNVHPKSFNKDFGSRSLHSASRHERENVIEILLEKGADIHAKTLDGFTALHFAAEDGSKNVMKLLLEKGADVDAKTFVENFTPLHFVAEYGRKNLIKMLLEKGADIHAKTVDGFSPLHLAYGRGVFILLANERTSFEAENIPTVFKYSVERRKDVAELLLEKGANINAKCNKGCTVLNLIRHICGKTVIKFNILHNQEETKTFSFQNDELCEFFNDCKNEVEKTLGTSTVPLYKFLQETNENKLAGYLSNKNTGIQKDLENITTFPIYASMIADRLKKAKKRECLMTKSKVVMEHSNFQKLPTEIKDKIVKSLTNSDLENFIKSAVNALNRKFKN